MWAMANHRGPSDPEEWAQGNINKDRVKMGRNGYGHFSSSESPETALVPGQTRSGIGTATLSDLTDSSTVFVVIIAAQRSDLGPRVALVESLSFPCYIFCFHNWLTFCFSHKRFFFGELILLFAVRFNLYIFFEANYRFFFTR